MLRATLALALLAAASFAAPAAAQVNLTGKMPSVEYRADSMMETEAGRIPSKVWFAKDRERREMDMGGAKTTTILRMDKQLMWTLMPEQKMYMETSFAEAAKKGDPVGEPAYDIEQTDAGEEVVNGITCKKTKVIMTSKKDGTKLGGFMWTSPEGILVKADTIAVSEGKKARFKLELTNLVIEDQPDELFEIPAGFSKFEMPGMKSMFKGMLKGAKP